MERKGKNEEQIIAVTFWSCQKGQIFCVIILYCKEKGSPFAPDHPATTIILIYVPQTTQERETENDELEGLIKAFEMGKDMDGYIYLTDLCQV